MEIGEFVEHKIFTELDCVMELLGTDQNLAHFCAKYVCSCNYLSVVIGTKFEK